ncbi:multicopper oxidase [Piedraia hortae CBS 480.64]|uniref:laccase n=1 Tax=Piedraia hortae CBS 480.64 TaxID=1314780 RepID=A0A6A7BXK6_9PEZI|nr:multicopper oxidase [Piedraia hortae CBS 480.64]
MRASFFTGLYLAAFSTLASAAALPSTPTLGESTPALEERADSQCTHGPTSRACWSSGYSIATDFDQKAPTTGKTVTYDLTVTNTTCNPDGNGARTCLLINNQYPGPLIRASWGDNLVITVHNKMQDNGTSIHWHGVRQLNSMGSDGVGGVTECPIAPGDSKTYRFRVTQFGTSWYHSHFSAQYGEGVIGPMIFDGPATANYDEDLGTFMLNEWFYKTASSINAVSKNRAGPPGDNVLINGQNKNANGGGEYGKITIESGKKYRLRFINSAVDNFYYVSLDNHPLQVITSDFIPIRPFYTNSLLIAIGQRYDVIINANQTAGNYWLRVDNAVECATQNLLSGRNIVTYKGVSVATPSSQAYPPPKTCDESPILAPYWKQPVPSSTFTSTVRQLDISLDTGKTATDGDTIVLWRLNETSLDVDWAKPTVQYVLDGNNSFPESYNVRQTVNPNSWNYWVIQQKSLPTPPIPHPIHLHGHDYFVLGQGTGNYSTGIQLNYDTPPRRDTAIVPGAGWMVIAFPSNNPGTWLMHCHIAWHVSGGLGSQFLESPSQIPAEIDRGTHDQTCANWKKYVPNMKYVKDDSGL